MKNFLVFFATLMLTLGGLGIAKAADSPWLYGIHWYGPTSQTDVEAMTGNKGVWDLETVMLYDGGWTMNDQLSDFATIASRGHTIIIRIQPRWGWAIPAPADRAQYLLDVATAATQAAPYCHIWQIGNEMNLYDEYDGDVLTAAEYISFYKQIRTTIKGVTSPLGEQKVLIGGVSPGAYYQEVRHTDGLVYLEQMCEEMTSADTDGFALHAYGGPWYAEAAARADLQNGYSTQLDIVDAEGFCDKPCYILEWNRQTNPVTDAWQEEQSARFIIGAYQDLNTWNNTAGNHPIVCATWFIYPDVSGWEIFSLRNLRDHNNRGVYYDLWDSFQYSCGLNYAAGSQNPPLCVGVIVDNDDVNDYSTTGTWTTSSGSGYEDGSYQYAITGNSHTATWTANLSESGVYKVYSIFVAAANRPSAASYSINTKNGSETATADQTQNSLTWVELGEYQFNSGNTTVTLDALNSTPTGQAAIADAIRFVKVGELPTPTPTPTPTPSPGLVVYQEMAADNNALTYPAGSSDNLNGKLATTISGGFHSAVTNANDKEPAFTDGAALSGVVGILQDYPGSGVAAWSGYWNLNNGAVQDLTEVRVYNGGSTGRVFQNYDIYVTSDANPSASSTWTLIAGNVMSSTLGTSNSGNTSNASMTRLTDSAGVIAAGVTALRIDQYAVANLSDVFIDAYDNGQTGDQDSQAAAFVSPHFYEIDAWFATPTGPTPTPSPSPTASPSPTVSPSPTASPVPTATPTATPTPTPSPTPTPTPSTVENILIEAEDFDTGANGTAYYDTSAGNTGGAYRTTDVDIETCGDGGYNVGWIDPGEWLLYSGVQASADTYAVTMRIASANAGGSFYIEVNGTNVTGTVSFAATGGWQTWSTINVGNISLNSGSNTIKLVVVNAGWNVSYMEFDRIDPSADPVQNGDFESFSGGVASNWTTWSSSWGNTLSFNQSATVHGGSASQQWGRSDSLKCHGGVYQTINVTSGQQYDISAWCRYSAGAGDAWLEFGYDLNGGTDPEGSNVNYTVLSSQENSWNSYSTTVTATGNTITLFSKGGTYNESGSNNWFWVDDVSVSLH